MSATSLVKIIKIVGVIADLLDNGRKGAALRLRIDYVL